MAELDLAQALQMFSQGAQQAATTAAVNDAAIQMQQINQQINQQMTDEAQKRVALQDLGNNLALRLVGTGADSTQVANAYKAVTPQTFGSAEQLQIEGNLQNNQFYKQQAEKIIGQRSQKQKDELLLQASLNERLQNVKFQQELAIEAMKQGGKQATVPGFELIPGTKLSDKDVESLKVTSAAYQTMTEDLGQLDKLVAKHSTDPIGFGMPERAQMLQLKEALALQLKEMENLGALAGPDVEVLSKILPDPTVFSEEKYKTQAARFKQILDTRIKNKAKARGVIWQGSQQLSQDMRSGVKVVKLKDGSFAKVRYLPDGRIQRIKD